MNTTELFELHRSLCGQALELMRKKNNDYAGHKGDTPFANFQRVESMGITSTEKGFLVRMTDKMSRLSTMATGADLLVPDEKVEDTLIDLINYSVLLYAYLQSHGRNPTNP
jgi:hypothetical protein